MRAAAEELLAGEGWEGNIKGKCMFSCWRGRDVHNDGIMSGKWKGRRRGRRWIMEKGGSLEMRKRRCRYPDKEGYPL